ncbi:hypothetical protein [Lysinibacillus sp. BW-2-10]|uniref:pilus assembly PilX family protein n=1 Tax=Lysinibacillus sp. BW-2-10 TaxID=2590030 RepID=UPI00117DC649|nr:hypothetical protein [Lysinibacillus sp. BW-2-10]TSI10135.1 hypothetical protein FJQ64_04505 [Lysinibacillus sp. BW-2-10]
MDKNPLLKNFLTNERGFSLVIALMTLVVLSVIGISIFSISNNTSKAAEWERDDQAVYYIAEAGLVEAKIDFQIIVDSIWDGTGRVSYDDNLINIETPILSAFLTNKSRYSYEPHFSKNTFANITINKLAKDQYVIYSKGNIDGYSNARAVSQMILIDSNGQVDDKSHKLKEIDPNTIPGPTPPSSVTPTIPPVGGGGSNDDGSDNGDKNCQGHGNPDCDRDDDKSDCPPKNPNCKDDDTGSDGDDGGPGDDPINDDDNNGGKKCQGHGNPDCDRDEDKSGCPQNNKNCKDNGDGSNNGGGSGKDTSPSKPEVPKHITDLLGCPNDEYDMPKKVRHGSVHTGNLVISEGLQTNGSLTINGDLNFTDNKDAFFVVNGDLIVTGDINFGKNKTKLVVKGKLIVKNINLHNKAEVTVEGDAELSDIIKEKGSTNQGFVCIKQDRITVKK